MSRFDGFDQYIERSMDSWNCPGAAVAVVKGNEILHQGAYGLRNVEEDLPLTINTRFSMASVTKSFTAMSVALLVDEGKLAWDEPVRKYMPEFILRDPYVTEHVTLRDMLSHRTGLPRHDSAAFRLDLTRAEFIKRMKHLRFSASFRQKFQYNNLMYSAAAYLVEKVAKQRWEEFVQERIFAPLGMSASNFVPEPPRADGVNADGYRIDRDEQGGAKGLVRMPVELYTELSPGASGGLFSTLADLIQWLKVHVNEGCAGEFQLVSAHNLKQMHLPQMIIPADGTREALMGNTIFTYGMGWFVEPYRGYTLIHHGGNLEGHSLMVGCVPQEKVGVVVLTNLAMLPLRDVLLYEAVDRALELPDHHWNMKFHDLYDPIFVSMAKGQQTSAEERRENAPPSHVLEAYAGTYKAEGYPDFAVKVDGNQLQARSVGSRNWSTLRHYHYNVFEWHLEGWDNWLKIQFSINDSGEVDAVSIPIEPAVNNVNFTRKPLELGADLVAALVGEYNPPLDGLTFTISAQRDKIYATQTGSPSEEIKPIKLTAQVVEFKLKRTRLAFVRNDDRISRLIIKNPGMTLEAPRME